MREALGLAAHGLGRTRPNPAVGALIVKDGQVVGRGFHARAGGPHAEVVALGEAGGRARGADLYTTLEPCDHFGKTPPCSLAILEAGIARVFSASADPNPLVRGRGLRRLKRAGVEVHTGVLAEEADAINRPFFKHIRTRLPYVMLKLAVTLDGRLATEDGDSRWVSSPAARAWVHGQRNIFDAVMVGVETALADDPQLTTRMAKGSGRDPRRIVLDSGLRVSPRQRLFRLKSAERTLVVCGPRAPVARERALTARGAEVWRMPVDRKGRLQLRALLSQLGEVGLQSVLVEGGATLGTALVREGLVDELALFVAPKLLGAPGRPWLEGLGVSRMADAWPVEDLSVERVGEDFLFRARLASSAGKMRKGRAKK
jgi:diaminohydroxyphosphoribosylaminopyrimidine deaminase/5-amino-6-(5-phosphoribosylamino)uracil reductase